MHLEYGVFLKIRTEALKTLLSRMAWYFFIIDLLSFCLCHGSLMVLVGSWGRCYGRARCISHLIKACKLSSLRGNLHIISSGNPSSPAGGSDSPGNHGPSHYPDRQEYLFIPTPALLYTGLGSRTALIRRRCSPCSGSIRQGYVDPKRRDQIVGISRVLSSPSALAEPPLVFPYTEHNCLLFKLARIHVACLLQLSFEVTLAEALVRY